MSLKEQHIEVIFASGHRLGLDIGLCFVSRQILGDPVVAVIKTAYGYRSIGITVEEVDDHFGVDSGDKLASPPVPCAEVGKADIAVGRVVRIEVEYHPDTPEAVYIDGIGRRLRVGAAARDNSGNG